ncbi:MAG: hypothetical protein QOE32_6434, partial [Pseudonocardiales bacterium]|nr:hypothetical protein [Pseudonocardiales bacterium]
MSEHQPDQGDEPPRLAPRPLLRPPVDAGSAELFGRPNGVAGAFEPVSVGGGADRGADRGGDRNGSSSNGRR